MSGLETIGAVVVVLLVLAYLHAGKRVKELSGELTEKQNAAYDRMARKGIWFGYRGRRR